MAPQAKVANVVNVPYDERKPRCHGQECARALEDEDVIVDAPTLARICRLDVRSILKLAEQGIVVRVARGRFVQWASLGNLIEHYREQAAGRIGGDETVDAVRTNCELKNSQRRLNDLRIARMEGELISLPEVEATWAEVALAIRQPTCP